MGSIWKKTAELPAFNELQGDLSTDVLIIGGGITGILLARMLARAGVDYALAEAGRLCRGVTGNTTAKITSQHGLIYHKLVREFGAERARMYLEANQQALASYRELCQTIDCGFTERDAFVYSLTEQDRLESELAALELIGFKAGFSKELPLPFPVAGAVRFPEQAQFNPLQFLSAIARDLNIYENTPVHELADSSARTSHGTIRAKRIVVATHFPFLNKHGAYFLKLYQQRSYVIALQNAQDVGGMYVDDASQGLSFRNYGDALLLGGGGRRTGKKSPGWQGLTDFSRHYYPNAREICRWAAQDCMTLDGVPYIGHYGKTAHGLYVATGYNKWGMTSAMVAATLLADMLTDRPNPYEAVFAPDRTILRPQLMLNAMESVAGLLTPSKKRCPHLGCALKWNPAERSWDCPCHGSRFTEGGKLINNPATGDLKCGAERKRED